MMIDAEKLIEELRAENERIFYLADTYRHRGDEEGYRQLAQRATGISDAIQIVYDSLEDRADNEPNHDALYHLSKVLYLDQEYNFREFQIFPVLALYVSGDGYRATTRIPLTLIYNNTDQLEDVVRQAIVRAARDIEAAKKEGPSEPSE